MSDHGRCLISDAIETELHEMEKAKELRRAKAACRGTFVQTIAAVVKFIVRPESMTAWATAAAALAAFLSVRAADRQEKATFQSGLATKEMDAIIGFESAIQSAESEIEHASSESYPENLTREHLSNIDNVIATIDKGRDSIAIIETILPRGIHDYILDIKLALSAMKTEFETERVTEAEFINAPSRPDFKKAAANMEKMSNANLRLISQRLALLTFCLAPQVRSGYNVDNLAFVKCAASLRANK